MRKLILILVLLLFTVNKSYATQEEDDLKLLAELGIEQEEQAVYQFPEIKPEAELMLGYRFVDVSGDKRAFEYEYLKDYPVFGGYLDIIKHPHRTHFNVDFRNNNDYESDLGYAYGELFISRWFHNTLFHNTDNIKLIDLDPSASGYSIDRRDAGADYDVKTDINNLMLRAKMPHFPAHAFFKLLHVTKNGSAQQRSLLGAGYFFNAQRTTMEREIDWQTGTYEIGANSHLGHAEVEYSHIEKRFKAGIDEAMFDAYTVNGFRPAGTYPHNQVPELKGSSNTIRVHSNYNERLVASATLSIKEKENETSGAAADIFQGAGSLQWTPLTKLSFFVNYSHIEIDADNPGTAFISDINGSKIIYPGAVKTSISKKTDAVSLTGRYNLKPGVILKARYLNENIDRDNASEWGLEDTTRKNSFSLSGNLRVIKGVNMKAEYIHKAIDQPSYNTESDCSNKGIASISWMPAAGINLLLNYSLSKDEREDLYFAGTPDAKDRDTASENLMGSGTFQLLNNLYLTASYSLMRNKIRQDIVYGTASIDNNVEYEDMAYVYSAAVNYIPVNKLNIYALIAHSKSTVDFLPGSQDLLSPVSVASFSEQEITENTYLISSNYECMKSLSCGLDIQYNDVTDELDNIHDSNRDGDGYIFLVSLKKKW